MGGELAWGDSDDAGVTGFEWPWIELLEHLAFSWKYLEAEELDPLGLAGDPDTLRARAMDRWSQMTEHDVAAEDEALRDFERTHDLAAALRGAWAPSLWIQRSGPRALIVGGAIRARCPFADARCVLEALGDAIGERIADVDDERARTAMRAWRARRRVPPR